MIEINLLPEKLRRKRREMPNLVAVGLERLANQPQAIFFSAAVLLLVIVQILIFASQLSAKSQFDSLREEYQSIAPRKKVVDEIRGEINKMHRKISAIDKLMVMRINWARKLNSLSDSMIPGIWLTDLSLDEKAVLAPGRSAGRGGAGDETLKYLAISGNAYSKLGDSTACVVKFIDSLKGNSDFSEDFSDIELGGAIEEAVVDGREVMKFKITCTFQEDRL